MKQLRLLLPVALTTLTLGTLTVAAHARITDAAGDFLSSYTGVAGGDLDVLSSDVTFDGTNFNITATLNGLVGTTPNAIYVWGFDRGAGTARFAAAPLLLNNVLFDSVVILRPDTTVTVNRLIEGTNTPFGAGTAIVSGNKISATISASELPTQGLIARNYTWNLWPRINGGTTANISDFAPNNTNAAVTVVPEAGSFALFAPAILGAVAVGIRRRKSA